MAKLHSIALWANRTLGDLKAVTASELAGLISAFMGGPAGDVHEGSPATSLPGGTDLGHAAEQALHYRRPSVVFVDEAQHLARIASGKILKDAKMRNFHKLGIQKRHRK